MRSYICKANSSGAFSVKGAGVGFLVKPALPSSLDAAYSATDWPGSFPLRATFRGSDREPMTVTNSDAFYFDARGFGLGIDFAGARPGDVWQVVVFESESEGVVVAGVRTRCQVRLLDAGTAVPNAVNPTTSADGWLVLPGMTAWTVYGGGTLRVCRLWVRRMDGTWVDTLTDLDFTTEPVVTRFVDAPADRVALVAAGAAMTICVEATMEVG